MRLCVARGSTICQLLLRRPRRQAFEQRRDGRSRRVRRARRTTAASSRRSRRRGSRRACLAPMRPSVSSGAGRGSGKRWRLTFSRIWMTATSARSLRAPGRPRYWLCTWPSFIDCGRRPNVGAAPAGVKGRPWDGADGRDSGQCATSRGAATLWVQVDGGAIRSRTGLDGFAIRCITALLSRRGRRRRRHRLPRKREAEASLCRDSGAGNETRTRDLNLGKVALYQLSYSRIVDSGLAYPVEPSIIWSVFSRCYAQAPRHAVSDRTSSRCVQRRRRRPLSAAVRRP